MIQKQTMGFGCYLAHLMCCSILFAMHHMFVLYCLAQASCGLCHRTEEGATNQKRGRLSKPHSLTAEKDASKVPAVEQVNCEDDDTRCGLWGQLGECLKNPSFMLRTCKVSRGPLEVRYSPTRSRAHEDHILGL